MQSHIDDIFGKPGASWTDDEFNRVWEWLHEDQQLRRLLTLALRCLGSKATLEDAEEAWGRFNLYPSSRCEGRWIFPLRGVVKSYDPQVEKGRNFWNYLWLSFKRFCFKEKKRNERETPLTTMDDDEDGNIIEIDIPDEDPGNNPLDVIEREEFRRAIERGLQTLKPSQRDVFRLCDLEGHSVQEAAERLNAPKGSIKGWLSRARQELKEYLRKEGWK